MKLLILVALVFAIPNSVEAAVSFLDHKAERFALNLANDSPGAIFKGRVPPGKLDLLRHS